MDSTTVAPPTPPRLSQRIVTLVGDARELLCDHLELAALEARRAGAGLVRTLCAAVVISLLAVTAWLALVAAGIVWVTDAGIDRMARHPVENILAFLDGQPTFVVNPAVLDRAGRR